MQQEYDTQSGRTRDNYNNTELKAMMVTNKIYLSIQSKKSMGDRDNRLS